MDGSHRGSPLFLSAEEELCGFSSVRAVKEDCDFFANFENLSDEISLSFSEEAFDLDEIREYEEEFGELDIINQWVWFVRFKTEQLGDL